jgi:hypothetical protein
MMSKVGTEFVDGGFDFLELGRGWGSGIVYKGLGIGIRLSIYRGRGVSVAGEGFISAIGILTVILRGSGERVMGAGS